ncbi:MAG: intradiol ring-cleavage dioxygenase [Bacteroidetes bacterium]|nr:intradiol ring-cleavage dioxygenase [Bacteroidota bacterium]
MDRKEFLKGMGVAGLSAIVLPGLDSCKKESVTPNSSNSTSGSSSTSSSNSGSCTLTSSETDGPYPLYTSRGSSIQRVDITEGKAGLLLSIAITITNKNNNCSPLAGVVVDIWHCDKDGYYSGYSGQNGYLGTKDYTGYTFLRGRQTTDSNGQVKFTTIYPGWYVGRMTHIHVQVYTAGNSANSNGNDSVITTQIAFPDDVTQAVYKTSLYAAHGENTLSFAKDNVFSDGYDNELCSLAGDTTNGYALTHTINVAG